MQIIRVKDQNEGGQKAFDVIKTGMQSGAGVLGLATGSTPITLYQEMVKSDVDFSNMVSVNLDEYVGLGAEDDQSYDYFMHEHLFNQKPFKKNYLPNGLAEDITAECKKYDQIIADNPIDIQVLGIGQNGHIGFNEPGTPFDSSTRKVQLTESTIEANKRFFAKKEDVPTEAISMGIGSIMQAEKVLLIAYGENKADAIYHMVEGAMTEEWPASALQEHKNVVVIVDDAAASKLSK